MAFTCTCPYGVHDGHNTACALNLQDANDRALAAHRFSEDIRLLSQAHANVLRAHGAKSRSYTVEDNYESQIEAEAEVNKAEADCSELQAAFIERYGIRTWKEYF